MMNFVLVESDSATNSLSRVQLINDIVAVQEVENIKTELVEEVDNYISRTSPRSKVNGCVIVDACLKYNVDIKFVLAQGHIESHFGSAGKAARTNSIFNLDKTKYKHPNHSIEPYFELLTSKYLVRGKTEKDLMKNYVNKGGKRYATSKTYERDLTAAYTKIKNRTKIDKLYNLYITRYNG